MLKRALIAAAVAVAALVPAPAQAIVGGTPASPPPWLAAVGSPLFFVRPSGQFCGGELVTARKLLTAAHCVKHLAAAPALLDVTFGRADLTSGSGVTVGVKSVWVDPAFHETGFDGQTVEHDDVAVLTLVRAVDRAAVPLVAAGSAYPAGAATTVLGWGTTSSSDLFNTRLRETTVNLTTDAACAAAYRSSFGAGDMVCAARPGHDTCEFDSGGPLLLHGRLAALTSWGNGCAKAGFPGVYARLAAFIPVLRAQLG